MLTVTVDQVYAALTGLGIRPGDGLLVHAALQFLGRPQEGVETYYRALCLACGIKSDDGVGAPEAGLTSGTLAVPTFNFGFARGEPYDPATTPSQGMGVLSEWVRQRPAARRTPHPMQSLAVIGRYAQDLTSRDTPSAFESGSAFDRMIELDFKLLLLGADIQAASIVHWSEQLYNVPYRYWKEFDGPVQTAAGQKARRYRMFVRDLQLDPRLDLRPIQNLLQARGQWACVALNYGKICLCSLRDFTAAADALLAADPWALVAGGSPIHL
jgi:aminoglycoside N3'-acetyltransferase